MRLPPDRASCVSLGSIRSQRPDASDPMELIGSGLKQGAGTGQDAPSGGIDDLLCGDGLCLGR